MQKLTKLIEEVAVTLGNQYTLTLIDDSWCLYRIKEIEELKHILRCVVNKTNQLEIKRAKVYQSIIQAV